MVERKQPPIFCAGVSWVKPNEIRRTKVAGPKGPSNGLPQLAPAGVLSPRLEAKTTKKMNAPVLFFFFLL